MQSVDWHGVFDSIENPSDLFKSFYTKLASVIDVHIPLKQLSRKEIRLKIKTMDIKRTEQIYTDKK